MQLYKIGLKRKEGKAFTPEELDREWRAVERMRQKLEREVEPLLTRGFNQVEKAVMDRIESLKDVKSDVAIANVFSLAEAFEILNPIMREIIERSIFEGLVRGQARLGISQTQRVRELAPDVLEEMIRKSKTLQISQTTEKQMIEAINRVASGLDREAMLEEIEAQVQDVFEDIKRNRIETIVRTTATAAFEAGQLEAFRISGIPYKAWLSQRDGRARESHDIADSQVRGINAPFNVGNARLMFPGDPDGPADEIIRCRCTMMPRTELQPQT